MVKIDSQRAFHLLKKNIWSKVNKEGQATAEVRVIPFDATNDLRASHSTVGYPVDLYFKQDGEKRFLEDELDDVIASNDQKAEELLSNKIKAMH